MHATDPKTALLITAVDISWTVKLCCVPSPRWCSRDV